MACIIHKKMCTFANNSVCIPVHMAPLQTPSILHFISWPLMGGSLHEGRRSTTAGSILMLWASLSQLNNGSNAERLHMEGKGKKENTPQHRGDSCRTAGGLLGYHSLIAAVEWPGNSCPSSRIQSVEYTSGELMDVSTGRAIWRMGKWMGPITLDGIMCDCYPSQVWYDDDGQGL